jgi:hypothetical protein
MVNPILTAQWPQIASFAALRPKSGMGLNMRDVESFSAFQRLLTLLDTANGLRVMNF